MYILTLAIYSVSYLLIPWRSFQVSREKSRLSLTSDRSTRSGLFRALYPDTGESGDTYDIDVQTEPLARTWFEFRTPSPRTSVRLLDTAESGDAYDAEVDQAFGGKLEDSSALQTVKRA